MDGGGAEQADHYRASFDARAEWVTIGGRLGAQKGLGVVAGLVIGKA
jgi:hypothetical protein